MEAVIIILLLAMLILIVVYHSSVNDKLNRLMMEMNMLKSILPNQKKLDVQHKEETIEQTDPDFVIPNERIKTTYIHENLNVEQEPMQVKETAMDAEKESAMEDMMENSMDVAQVPVEVTTNLTNESINSKPSQSPKLNRDLEKFIGENLLSKIGIAILVLGVGFFVKYAIDQHWINEYGRVLIGILTGGLLIGLAHRIRNSYRTFSSLLTGGGLAVLYLTITIAFQEYHLFSQSAAFVILIIITVFSVILSLLYDKKELAIFSQMGGYAAPFMITNGEGNYVVLFSYILILNAGLIVLAYYKRWYILNILAFVFTSVIYAGWLTEEFFKGTTIHFSGYLLFASIFYLVFFMVNILNNLKENKRLNGIEISIILANNFFYFFAGIVLLNHYHLEAYRGPFTLAVALYNFVWVLYLFRRKQIDTNLIYLLIGLVISFVSIAIPIQLNGYPITLLWTSEFVILLWLSNVAQIRFLKVGHLILLTLAMISLILNWRDIYGNDLTSAIPVILNQAFITGIVWIAGLSTSIYLLSKEKELFFVRHFINVKDYRGILIVLLFILAYLVPYLELQYQMNRSYSIPSFLNSVYGIYHFAYLFALLSIIRHFKWIKTERWFYYISLIGLFVYLVYDHTMDVQTRDEYFAGNSVSLGNFLFHYVVYPFIIGILIILVKDRHKLMDVSTFWSKTILWFIAFFVIFMCSAELDNIWLLAEGSSTMETHRILQLSHRVGYPVLWGILAFLLIIRGIRNKNKIYRIISLSLFSLILVKLFLFDVWEMNEGGRIASFIFLGIILLLVSFLYQKLKRFLLDEPVA